MKHDRINADRDLVVGTAEFKAKCLDILSRLGSRDLDRVTVTRRGKPVAELFPPTITHEDVRGLFGCMRGSVTIPEGLDLTAPVIDMSEWQPDDRP